MVPPPLPADENKRLASLYSLEILDTPSEDRFDRITRIASSLFNVPISLITLVDSDRQWFKSSYGLSISETKRSISFCGYTINGEDLFIVPDAHQDPRFYDNPLVIGNPNIRFYAGCPLTAPDGSRLGSFSIIDRSPRQMSDKDRLLLRDLGAWAESEINQSHYRESFKEESSRQLVESLPAVFWLSNPEKSEWHYMSPYYERLWRRSLESLYRNPQSFLDPIDGDDLKKVLFARDKHAVANDDLEYRIVWPDGTIRWIRERTFPIKNEAGEVYRLAGFAVDVTDQKHQEEKIRHLAYYDSLTDLPNRTLLYDRLCQAILSGLRDQKPLTLLLMDLNRFKEINDTLGHQKGDQVLKQVGIRLRNVVRESDTIARLGGDEFAILLPGVGDTEYAQQVARKILHSLEHPFILDGISVEVGTSIGIAFCPEHAEEVNHLMQRADVAMYAAKEAGVGYIFYSPAREKHTLPRLKLMGELGYAIEHEELRLYYQPKLSIKTKQVIGVEALLRWQHPYRGLIYPDQFIPLAEQTGLINPLTQWVLNELIRQSNAWSKEGRKVSTSLNLSGRVFQNVEMIESIPAFLSKWNVDPNLLTLELPESVIMEDPSRASDVLSNLRKKGISISMDDFGTGYSSLSFLKKLPLDEIKIDNSLIAEMVARKEDAIIVHSIIDLAHHLNLFVVAEGVEDESAWRKLDEFGCDAAQGYYMSRPVSALEVTHWLTASSWPSPPTLF